MSKPASPTPRVRQGYTVSAYFDLLACVLLGSMAVFPIVESLLYVKAVFIALLLLAVFGKRLVTRRQLLHVATALWLLYTILIGIVFVSIGYISSNPGALKSAQLYIFWPIVYGILICGLTYDLIENLDVTLLIASILIPLYALVLLFSNVGLLPDWLYVPILDQGQAFGAYDGHTELNLYSFNSLVYLLPYCITSLLVLRAQRDRLRPVRWVAVILGVGVVLFGGRRGLVVSFLLAPVVAVALGFGNVRRNKLILRMSLLTILIACIIGLALYTLGADLHTNASALVQYMRDGFSFVDPTDIGAAARRAQFDDLISGFRRAPVFGVGFGAPGPSVIESPTMPWSYELSYVALLYHTGVVGVSMYAASIGWVLVMGWRLMNRRPSCSTTLLPHLTAMCCLLVVNATNPLLMRFDGLWAVFLSVGVMNRVLLGPPGRRPATGGPRKVVSREDSRALLHVS